MFRHALTAVLAALTVACAACGSGGGSEPTTSHKATTPEDQWIAAMKSYGLRSNQHDWHKTYNAAAMMLCDQKKSDVMPLLRMVFNDKDTPKHIEASGHTPDQAVNAYWDWTQKTACKNQK